MFCKHFRPPFPPSTNCLIRLMNYVVKKEILLSTSVNSFLVRILYFDPFKTQFVCVFKVLSVFTRAVEFELRMIL